MSSKPKVSMTECPECDARLRFRRTLRRGEIIQCPECDVALEVISVEPLELDWANEDAWDFEDRD